MSVCVSISLCALYYLDKLNECVVLKYYNIIFNIVVILLSYEYYVIGYYRNFKHLLLITLCYNLS